MSGKGNYMDQIVIDEKRIEEIIEIVKSMKDNDSAHFSMVTHVIFSDFNLSRHLIETALEDCVGWSRHITDKAQELDSIKFNSWGSAFTDVLQDVLEVHEALRKLFKYTDDELDLASDRLWG